MKERNLLHVKNGRNNTFRSAKECAFIAVFVATTVSVQIALSFVPGVEIVTVMFVAYSFVMGVKRGVISAVAFALIRQIFFGFAPTVLILYLIYFPMLTIGFGFLGGRLNNPLKYLIPLSLFACICTVFFTMIDNILTPLWYGYGEKSTWLYFTASLPFMITQVICTAISAVCLFFPLYKIFSTLKRTLES